MVTEEGNPPELFLQRILIIRADHKVSFLTFLSVEVKIDWELIISKSNFIQQKVKSAAALSSNILPLR